MKRLVLSVITATLLFTHSIALVSALTLDAIGPTPVTGTISSWTFYGRNPTFAGTTDPSAAVTISLSGINQTVTADGSGNWSHTPTNLVDPGSYPITINSSGNTISFTLELSNADGAATTNTIFSTTETTTSTTSTTTGSQPVLPNELPQTGAAQETLLLLGGGFGLLTAGVLFYWKVVPKLLLEESLDTIDDSADTRLR